MMPASLKRKCFLDEIFDICGSNNMVHFIENLHPSNPIYTVAETFIPNLMYLEFSVFKYENQRRILTAMNQLIDLIDQNDHENALQMVINLQECAIEKFRLDLICLEFFIVNYNIPNEVESAWQLDAISIINRIVAKCEHIEL